MNDLVLRAERQWQSCLENNEQLVALARLDDRLAVDALKVFEASEYVSLACQRNPGLLVNLLQDGALYAAFEPGVMAQQLETMLDDAIDELALQHTLRCFRRIQMVRIIWRDITRLAPLAETLEDLSALADMCVEKALERLYGWETGRLGTPRSESDVAQQLVVLGMGKLGARELNLSSDIDLIFAFPEHGKLDGRRPMANEQFFTRLCQKLVQVLGSQTVDGFVFRVDCRLRPFGDAGPLVLSFDGMENYYHSQAREWERYAMVKARVIAGDQQRGAELMEMLQHFVYRRYLDFGVIDSLRKMKALISQELVRKGMDGSVKLGRGGIREVEFIGQVFQLMRGGRDPELRVRPILQVLEKLGTKGLMPPDAVQQLTDGYVFLRLVENRIQAWQDRQTHQLPDDDEGKLRLARAMGYASWSVFFVDLELHRGHVQEHFDQVFAVSESSADSVQDDLADVWLNELDESAALILLKEHGFADAPAVVKLLQGFRGCHACRRLGLRGQQRMDQLIPLLLKVVGSLDEHGLDGSREDTLERLLKLIESVARRTSYLALLVEYPLALAQLVRLGGASSWVVKCLSQQPILLDELLDARRLYSPLGRAELDRELGLMLTGADEQDVEHQMERLRQFAQGNMLRVAAADIAGVIPVMVVSDYLTWIAESVLERVVDHAWRQLESRHGRPAGLADGEKGVALIGYGKLGGIELGYGSDLDLVFLCDGAASGGVTSGPRSLANEVFYARLGQRMIHLLSTRTAAGQLYEVDMRLRPNGNSGLLISSLEAFEIYQKESAWTWEHQALVRARVVVGDAEMLRRFERIRREVLAVQRDPDKLRDDVRLMRDKMRQALDNSKPGFFDLKQGRGGIADIEFMVQYAVLRWAFRYPELLEWSDNVRLLATLAEVGVLGDGVAEQLAQAYRCLRDACHHATLMAHGALIGEEQLFYTAELLSDESELSPNNQGELSPANQSELSLDQQRNKVINIWGQLMVRKTG